MVNQHSSAVDTAKVTSKGQVTIPKRVRDLMAIKTGDRLAFDLDEEGGLRVSPIRDEKPLLRGLLSDYAKVRRVDGERIRTALRKRAAAKHAVR